jgi:hypothetical protein
LVSGVAAVTPCAFNDGVKLSDSRLPPVPLANNEPCLELPPLFDTMFITSPAVSTSPSPPPVTKVVSSTLPASIT